MCMTLKKDASQIAKLDKTGCQGLIRKCWLKGNFELISNVLAIKGSNNNNDLQNGK